MSLDSIAPTWSTRIESEPGTGAEAGVYAALRRLDAVGIRAAVRRSGGSWRPLGTTARVGPGRFPARRLERDLADGLSVSVHLGPGVDPDWLDGRLARLGRHVAVRSPDRLVWSVESDDGCADEVIATVRRYWPASPGYCFESPSSSTPAEAGREGATRWFPAMHAGVRSHCPLLSSECSTVLLPGNGLAVPFASGWLCMELDLLRIAGDRGIVDTARLEAALDRAIVDGDRLVDAIHWPTTAEAEDARLNRRLALMVTGIGDLVAARGQDPSSLDCLRALDGLMEHIHTGLWDRSRRLAAATAPLPVLTERVPGAGCRDEAHRIDWLERWREAVGEVQVRHRNLLALSPWSLLPRQGQVQPAFVDLAPILAHADALAFGLQRVPSTWSAADFRYFRARVVAQVKRMNATTFIAVGA